jgi:hypothetical protein
MASFIVSLFALAGSLGIGIRQLRMSRGASHLSLSMSFLNQYFDGGFAQGHVMFAGWRRVVTLGSEEGEGAEAVAADLFGCFFDLVDAVETEKS